MKGDYALFFRIGKRRICNSLIAILWLAAFVLCGCATTDAKKESDADAREKAQIMEEKWGISVKSVGFAAGGNLVDLRYRVSDSEKASTLLRDKETKAYLVNEKTGAALSIPDVDKIGALRSSAKNLIAGKVYFMMFANPVSLVKKGDEVTVVIGGFKAEHLVVQ
jgi:hypothetical protein